MASDRRSDRRLSWNPSGGTMRYLRAALRRLAGFFTGHRQDDELREELQSHLEMETDEYIRRGMDPDAARRRARLASGGLTQAAQAVRDQSGPPRTYSILAHNRDRPR